MFHVRRKIEDKIKFYRELEKKPASVFFGPFDILGLTLITLFSLYAFFPEGELEKNLMNLNSSKHNIDLTIAYIKALSETAKNPEKKLEYETILTNKLLFAVGGKEALSTSQLPAGQKETLNISQPKDTGASDWDIAKSKYLVTKDKYLRKEVSKKEVEDVLNNMYLLSEKEPDKVEFLLYESFNMDISSIYLKVIEDFSKTGKMNKDIFLKILKLALKTARYKFGENIIELFGDRFFGDKDAEVQMVRFLLMAGKPEKAGTIVKKIMAFKEQK